MLTRCPNCSTVFRVNDTQKNAASGSVRCCICNNVFDADASKAETNTSLDLFDEYPGTESISQAYSNYIDKEPDIVSGDVSYKTSADDIATNPPEQQPIFPTPPKPDETPDTDDQPFEDSSEPSSDQPLFMPEETAEPPITVTGYDIEQELLAEESLPKSRSWPWIIGVLVLALVLAGQLIYWKKDQLAMDPTWAPYLHKACTVLGCQIAPLVDLSAIQLLERNVSPHESNQTLLVVEGKLVNEAAFAQPFPLVEFTLKTAKGQLVGSRVFQAQEYLPQQEEPPGIMTPGTIYPFKLEIVDRKKQGQQFEFRFY